MRVLPAGHHSPATLLHQREPMGELRRLRAAIAVQTLTTRPTTSAGSGVAPGLTTGFHRAGAPRSERSHDRNRVLGGAELTIALATSESRRSSRSGVGRTKAPMSSSSLAEGWRAVTDCRQGFRCAARCAWPCRAILDCAAAAHGHAARREWSANWASRSRIMRR